MVWTQRLGGNFSSSPVYANGLLYIGNEEGKFFVYEAAREFNLVAEHEFKDGFLASPRRLRQFDLYPIDFPTLPTWKVILYAVPNLILFFLLVGVGYARTVSAARPNILFIYADDQSYKTLSCYDGAPDWVKTPNIDRLASKGCDSNELTWALGACLPAHRS